MLSDLKTVAAQYLLLLNKKTGDIVGDFVQFIAISQNTVYNNYRTHILCRGNKCTKKQ